MTTSNEQLSDLSITNQILIERFKNSVSSSMLIFFRNMEKQVQKEIKAHYDEDRLIITEKNVLKRKLNEIQEIELNKIHTQIMRDVHKFLGSQAHIYENQLKEVLSEVSDFIKVKRIDDKTLKKIYDKEPITFDKGKYYTLNTLWSTFFLSVRTTLNQNTESAYKLKKTTREYTSDLNKGYKINENSLATIIAVYIQQASQVASKSVNKVNENFVRGYMWLSTLDSRTSPICIDYSGKVYYHEFPERSTLPYEAYPPIHFFCRNRKKL